VKHVDEAAEYMPSRLFDLVRKQHELKTDKALANLLGIGSPQTSRVRHRLLPISGELLIRIQEVTGLHIQEIKVIIGDRRNQHRPSHAKVRDVGSLRAEKPSNENVCRT
jgi:hypothetical protein